MRQDPKSEQDLDVETTLESAEEQGEERPGVNPASENLLDRLLYRGTLPRYCVSRSTSQRSTFSNPTLQRAIGPHFDLHHRKAFQLR